MYPTTKNIVLGAGHIYFDPLDASGDYTGERYLAETPGFSLAANATILEDWTADGATAEKHVFVTTQVTRDFTLTLKDFSPDNFALFVMGDASTITTTSASVTSDPINGGNGVLQGRWYQLGVSTTKPTGVRAITSLVIGAHTVDVDYKQDLTTGRIYIIPGGGIADDDVITCNYSTTAVSWDHVASNDDGAVRGALRFVAANTNGNNMDFYAPDVRMNPNGSMELKSRDTVSIMTFSVSAQVPDDGRAAVYVNGRAA